MACGGLGSGVVTEGLGARGSGVVTEGLGARGSGDVMTVRRGRPEPCALGVVRELGWFLVVLAVCPVPPEGVVCVAAPMPRDAPTAPASPSEARPVWSRLLR